MSFKPYAEAAVVLSTGVILTGDLRFYYDRDVIALTSANDSTYTLPAQLVRGFAAKDDVRQQRPGDTYIALQRIFRTFPLPAKKNAPPGMGFYEQLNRGPGPVLLLRRERAIMVNVIIPQPPANPNIAPGRSPATIALPGIPTMTLYLGTATGTPVVLGKPDDVLKHFARHAPALRAYARQNKLRYTDNLRDLSFLVNYANTLSETTP